jgi:hypothetical protein
MGRVNNKGLRRQMRFLAAALLMFMVLPVTVHAYVQLINEGGASSVTIPSATDNGDIVLNIDQYFCRFIIEVVTKTSAEVGVDPDGFNYPYGLVEFQVVCNGTGPVDVTITFPGNIRGATYRKYGPTPPYDIGGDVIHPGLSHWYTFPVTFSSTDPTSVTLRLEDGKLGDDTGVDGVIYDQGGIGIPLPVGVPTMTEWGMIIFIALAGLCSVFYLRKQRKPVNPVP